MAQRINMKTMLALLITATGSAWAQDTAPTQTTQPAAAEPAQAKPVVKVLDAGKGEKVELRYAPKVGQSFLMTMGMDMSMEMSMAGQKMPAQEMPKTTATMRVKTEKVEADSITYSMVVESIKAEGGPMAEMMNAMLGSVKGMKGTGVITSRGENKSLSFEVPANLDPTMGQSLSSLEDSMRNATTYFPEEAIGVGGKWQAITLIDADGIKMKQTLEYTLETLSDGVAKLGVKVSQTAEPQEVTNDQLPPGMTLRLESLLGIGTGSTTLNLAWLVPVESAGTSKTEIEMSADQFGEMSQAVSTKLRMTGKAVD